MKAFFCLLLAMSVASQGLAQGRTKNSERSSQSKRSNSKPAGNKPSASVPEDARSTEQARKHFTTGMSHFDKRRFREALREFKLAAQLVNSADLYYNIARAHEELSEEKEAIEAYRRYLRDRVDPPDKATVERRIEALRVRRVEELERIKRQPKVGELSVRGSEPQSKVTVGGKSISTKRQPAANQAAVEEGAMSKVEDDAQVLLKLEPGVYPVNADEENMVPFRSSVKVSAGVTTAAYVDRTEKTQYRSIRGKPFWAWIVGGLAVGALAASIGVGVKASKTPEDERARFSNTSDALLGSSLVLGLTSGILYFVERRATGTEKISGGGNASAGRESP